MKFKRPILYKHGGCKECKKNCKFNGEIARQTKNKLFDCNSKKGD